MHSPVIAGIAQVANKDDDRIVHPLELVEEVARRALDDAGIDAGRVGAVLSTPLSVFAEARACDLLGERLGLPPGPREESRYSGAGPQRLLARACALVADGAADAVLVVGGIADASVRRARARGAEPPAPPTSVWSQGSNGTVERPLGSYQWDTYNAEMASGGGMPSSYFALVESALAAGVDFTTHRARLGELLAPFTAVAARRPDVAWFPHPRTASEIARPGPDNRFVAEPYTKLMCSFPTVDLAAAVVVTSTDLAAGDGLVHPRAIAMAKEAGPPSTRPRIDHTAALDGAVAAALRLAGIEPAGIALFDFYSCFPAAVQLACRAFGLGPGDERPRTVTGGLPYFGGPGASYSLHGLVCMVEELRARPGAVGAVVGLGGMVNDFSVGLYSTEEAPFAAVDLGTVSDGAVEVRPVAAGPAVVEAMTVLHDRDAGPVTAPAIVRLPDGSRTGARAADPELPGAVSGTSLVGAEVVLTTTDDDKVRYRLA